MPSPPTTGPTAANGEEEVVDEVKVSGSEKWCGIGFDGDGAGTAGASGSSMAANASPSGPSCRHDGHPEERARALHGGAGGARLDVPGHPQPLQPPT